MIIQAFLRSVFDCEQLIGSEEGSLVIARFLNVTEAQWTSTVFAATDEELGGGVWEDFKGIRCFGAGGTEGEETAGDAAF